MLLVLQSQEFWGGQFPLPANIILDILIEYFHCLFGRYFGLAILSNACPLQA